MTRRRLILAGGLAACLRVRTGSSQQSTPNQEEWTRALGTEKSMAAQFISLLNQFGPKDMAQYAKGIVLYASAKADFDGLISELELRLVEARPPDQNASFQAALKQAVEKRVTFTDFVSNSILPQTSGTSRGVGSFIQTVPELLKVLIDAGISIWHEYRLASDTRRKEIRQVLENLRWPPFTR
jgi:hypothetical protein